MLNYISPTVNPDDMLNGSFTGPIVAPVNSALGQLPRTSGAGIAAAGVTAPAAGTSQGVLIAWLVLFGLLELDARRWRRRR